MIKSRHSRILAGLLFLFTCLAQGSVAETTLPLEVTLASGEAPVELTLDALDAMEQISFSTTTIWTDGVTEFSGVSLKALLAALGAQEGDVEMTALNDYAVTMPMGALEDGAPIVATRMNGDTMSVREKGPYWVVFPYDSDPKYSTETTYARSIWQLNRLKIVD